MFSQQPGTIITDHNAAVLAMQYEKISLLDGGEPPDFIKGAAAISPALWDSEHFVQEFLQGMRTIDVSFIGFASHRLRNDPDFLIRTIDSLFSADDLDFCPEDKPSLAYRFVNAAMPTQHGEALSIYAGLFTGLYGGDLHDFLESEFVGVFNNPADPAVQALNLAVSEPRSNGQTLHKSFWARYRALVAAG